MGITHIRTVLTNADSSSNVDSLIEALELRASQIRTQKRLALRALHSLHDYLEANQQTDNRSRHGTAASKEAVEVSTLGTSH